MINACLIGAGRMGRDHAKHIVQTSCARVHTVVDPSEAAGREVAERFGANYCPTTEEALADPAIDAVVIVSKTDTHADLIELAARAGKPIFCEKPIDIDLERIDRCLEVVESTGVPLLVGFNRRFDPSFRELHRRLRSGEIGNLEMVTISSRDFRLPHKDFLKASGGLFRDMMIHDFDMARWLLGEEPVEIHAMGSRLIDPSIAEFGDVDTAMVVMKTESGKLCQISCSRRSVYGYDQRIEAFGSEGMLQGHNPLQSTVTYSGEQGTTGAAMYPSFPQRYAQAYVIEMEHFFADVVRDGKTPWISGFDGRQAIVVADAATQSFETGTPQSIRSCSICSC